MSEKECLSKLQQLQEEKLFLLDELEKTQQGLLSLSLELEKRVEARTAELANANKELEAFSYSVSHDLATPLQIIYGFSQLLLKNYGSQLDSNGQKFLGNINHGCQNMIKMIQSLLMISHVNNKTLDIHDHINISTIAQEVIEELYQQYPERQKQVHFKVEPNIMASGDVQLLHIVLQNLLGNAWKYSSKQSNALIELGTLPKKGSLIYFVKDNGAGFDMTHSEKLFTAFQRLHNSSEFPGTGIGLATVARIIKKHKGKIWAESEVGKGATFYFTLWEST